MGHKIITVGCSFTSIYNPIQEPVEYSHFRWTDFLAKKMGCEVYENLGLSGSGSRYANSTVYHKLIESNDVDQLRCIIVAWPSANRKDQMYRHQGVWLNRWERYILHHDMPEFRNHTWLNDTLIDMWSTYYICKEYNVPYIGFQMGPMYGNFGGDSRIDHTHECFEVLDEANVPPLKEMPIYKALIESNHLLNDPAFCLYDELDLYKYRYKNLGEDVHFDEDGHKLVSEWLYDKIQRLGY